MALNYASYAGAASHYDGLDRRMHKWQGKAVKTVLKTTNPATLSFAEAVLKDAAIPCFVLDQHMSAVEGSIGAIPRRLNVIDEDAQDARNALTDAGLGAEIYQGL